MAGLRAVFASAFVTALVTPAAAPARTVLPFELTNDHVFIDVGIGAATYHFVFDSGAPFGLLDRAVARELGLAVRERRAVGGVGDGEARAGETTVDAIRLGDLTFSAARFVVTDLHDTIGIAEGRAIDGVVGREVLERFATTFDYGNRSIVLDADPASIERAGATFVAMHLHRGVPQIACRIATVPATCNVDTGSRLALTLPAPFVAAHPEVAPSRWSALGVDGFGLGGPAYGRFGSLASLTFGDVTFADVLADYSAQTRGAFADPELGANIGGGLLRRFAVTFDYRHGRIGFAKTADFDRPEAPDRSGLFLVGPGGIVRVLDTRPGSPAARAGIAKDDVILAVDGRDVVAGGALGLLARGFS
ncbi:MAG: hypothetical protein NVS2B3_06180 [Vulcanimicrobiaceae bacterium]